jgi:hypothetical protein
LYDQIEEFFDRGKLDTTYPPSVYEAFLKMEARSFDYLVQWPNKVAREIEKSFIGFYQSRSEFINDYLYQISGVSHLPEALVIDEDKTWEKLEDDYDVVLADESPERGMGWYFAKG